MSKIKKILRWIWEFPQCLLGLILIKLYKAKYKETYKEVYIYTAKFSGGISLGLYVIINYNSYRFNKNFIKQHEYGHTVQSKYLGPLYLPTVGLCSICWVGLRKISKKLRNKSYYSVWPENWADKLGGVVRYE